MEGAGRVFPQQRHRLRAALRDGDCDTAAQARERAAQMACAGVGPPSVGHDIRRAAPLANIYSACVAYYTAANKAVWCLRPTGRAHWPAQALIHVKEVLSHSAKAFRDSDSPLYAHLRSTLPTTTRLSRSSSTSSTCTSEGASVGVAPDRGSCVAGCVAGPAAVAAIAAAITYKLICCMAVKIDGLQTLLEHACRL